MPNPVAEKLVVASAPGLVRAHATFDGVVIIELNTNGNIAVHQRDVLVTAALSNGDGTPEGRLGGRLGGTLEGTLSVKTDDQGRAVFNDFRLDGLAGLYEFTFSSPGLAGSLARLTLIAGSATTMTIMSGDAQTVSTGSAVAVAPSVKVTDADGNATAGVAVTFAVTAGGGSVTGPTQNTNASGIATATRWTLGGDAGANTLSVASPGVASVTFNATATLATIGTAEARGPVGTRRR